MKFSQIQPGFFIMGSDDEKGNEKPAHKVEIKNGFEIGTTPITQIQWKVIMNTSPWKGKEFIEEGNNFPATYITWEEAYTFITRLNALDPDNIYRFPTEAEWEYCCRAGSTTKFHFGDDPKELFRYGWFDKNGKEAGMFYAQEVAQLKANPWKLFDMHGNIWEWVEDWYIDSYEKGKSYDYVDDKVLRGGGWDYSSDGARSAFRNHIPPGRTNWVIGFRVVKQPR